MVRQAGSARRLIVGRPKIYEKAMIVMWVTQVHLGFPQTVVASSADRKRDNQPFVIRLISQDDCLVPNRRVIRDGANIKKDSLLSLQPRKFFGCPSARSGSDRPWAGAWFSLWDICSLTPYHNSFYFFVYNGRAYLQLNRYFTIEMSS
jgi:hypothetical protein